MLLVGAIYLVSQNFIEVTFLRTLVHNEQLADCGGKKSRLYIMVNSIECKRLMVNEGVGLI